MASLLNIYIIYMYIHLYDVNAHSAKNIHVCTMFCPNKNCHKCDPFHTSTIFSNVYLIDKYLVYQIFVIFPD